MTLSTKALLYSIQIEDNGMSNRMLCLEQENEKYKLNYISIVFSQLVGNAKYVLTKNLKILNSNVRYIAWLSDMVHICLVWLILYRVAA